MNEAAVKQRADVERLNASLRADLSAQGLRFINVDTSPFRDKLQGSDFYREWK